MGCKSITEGPRRIIDTQENKGERKIDKSYESDDIIFQNYLSDKKEKSRDQCFLKLKEYEKQELKQLFINLKNDYTNTILQDKNFKLINIEPEIISNIIENEQSKLIYKKKITDEISNIRDNKEESKITQLTILVVGKKSVGKSTLIKYILKLNENLSNTGNNDEEIIPEENFISYKNKNVPYLKLIEFKGIGLDKDVSPEIIQQEALECIKNKIGVKKNNNNYDEFINCIWYCITGARLENAELILLEKLSKAYTDKQIPIILVYTKAYIKSDAQEMKEYSTKKIKSSFVEVLAKDSKINNTDVILESFGKEKLLSETLLRCTEALQGEMIELMTKKISEDIKKKIKDEINNVYKDITENFKETFEKEFIEVKYDNEYREYIIEILGKNINKFYKGYINNLSKKV